MSPDDPMLPVAYRVEKVTKETRDTFTLVTRRVDRAPRHAFEPGQFSMLYVCAVGELPISISGDTADKQNLTYTVRSVGQVTNQLVSLGVGDTLGVRGPFGVPWPVEEARGKDVVVVAGGIGLAPLRPVLYHILRRREEYGRLVLLYGARSPQDQLFRKELTQWSQAPESRVLTTVDYGGVNWHGHVGVVTTMFRYIRLRPERTIAMVCGPEIMMRFVARELETRGVERSQIRVSMERNMKCGCGFCGHCQYGPDFICKDGPVFSYDQIQSRMEAYEI